MSTSTRDERSPSTLIGEEAQRALRERPSISIRTRLTLGFLLWFILSLSITGISIITISRIKNKLYFLEAAGNYSFEIQQARRFEKNYFLYHTNLNDSLEHIHNAKEILEKEGRNIAPVVGKANFETMTRHLKRYEKLLYKLVELDRNKKESIPAEYDEIEAELREHGAEMVAVAEELVTKERKSVNSMLLISQRIPIAFLFVLILLIIYLAIFIARQMLAPLSRMMKAVHRIAEGDLTTPIRPRRKYNDEFSKLAIAINHMMQQLAQRHDMLVRAHKLQAVGTLTAGIAHELNNPINNILLTAAMLLEDYQELPDKERLDMVNDLVNQSERAHKIVRNLLDFAREREIETESIEAQEIIEETLQLAANQIKLAKVKVKGEIDPHLPPIYGDRRQLIQVFLNIVLNALDAMPKGGTLSISISNSQDRNFVVIDFTDTGTGMPEHVLSNIFDPFFTTKPNAQGTGLGLSVSLGIIKQHGGDIKVKSKVNEGTTFTVLLPIAKVPADISNEPIA